MRLGERFFIGIIHAFTSKNQSLSHIDLDLVLAWNQTEQRNALQVKPTTILINIFTYFLHFYINTYFFDDNTTVFFEKIKVRVIKVLKPRIHLDVTLAVPFDPRTMVYYSHCLCNWL